MNIDPRLWLPIALAPLLAGCEQTAADLGGVKSTFGEANRQTMLAQVIEPDPQYDTLGSPSSAEHAAQAVTRYRTDKIKQPERIRTTESISNGGSGGGSSR